MSTNYVSSKNNKENHRRSISMHHIGFVTLLLGGVTVMLATYYPILSVDPRKDNPAATLKDSSPPPKRGIQTAPARSDDPSPVVASKFKNENADNDTRPFFVFHLGPPKTGSSSISKFLKEKSYQNQFHSDNYETEHNVKFVIMLKECFKKNNITCYKPHLDELVQTEANIIASDENFIPYIGTEAFKRFYFSLQEQFRVRIVVYYRRHFESVVSWRKEHYTQRITTGFRKIETLASYYEQSLTGKGTFFRQVSPTVLVNATRDLNLFHLDNATKMEVRNFHVEDVLEEFFCHAVPKAPHVCGLFPMEFPRQNPTYTGIDYDSIAYEALQQGILSHNVLRARAGDEIRRYQEEVLNKTTEDLPHQTCLSAAQLEKLRQASYDLESKYMPAMIETHNADFKKAKAKGMFCSVNAPKVLEDGGWQSFLRNIKADP